MYESLHHIDLFQHHMDKSQNHMDLFQHYMDKSQHDIPSNNNGKDLLKNGCRKFDQ